MEHVGTGSIGFACPSVPLQQAQRVPNKTLPNRVYQKGGGPLNGNPARIWEHLYQQLKRIGSIFHALEVRGRQLILRPREKYIVGTSVGWIEGEFKGKAPPILGWEWTMLTS